MCVYVSVPVFENLFFLGSHVRLGCDDVKAWVTRPLVNVREGARVHFLGLFCLEAITTGADGLRH